MGGDHGPSVTLPACRAFLAAHPQAELLLVGRADALEAAAGWPRCTRVVASEVVEMTDSVETALRKKKDSSLRVAVSQVKAHTDRASLAQACVSAGNTGALMAVSRYVLKTTVGIDRPAIATVMPNQRDGYTTVLDLGANVDCTAEHLLQFAVMGSALVSAVSGKAEPTVGLLNIGEEAIKGGEAIKQAGELLRAAAAAGIVNFHGNVEANDIFKGTTDIVVCDGFVGNVMLKTAEGLASMLTQFIKEEFTRNAFTKLAALAALPVLNRFKTPRRPPPLQRRGAARPARPGVQEPWLGRRVRVRAGAQPRPRRGPERPARPGPGSHQRHARGDAGGRGPRRRRQRVLAGHRLRRSAVGMTAPALPRYSRITGTGSYLPPRPASATPTSRRDWPRTASRPPTTGSSSAPASAFAISPRPDVACSDLAVHAARRALEAADCDPGAIDLIIVATSTPDMVFPSAACLVQQKLGVHGCAAFDVQAVCSGFVYALAMADSMIKTGMATQGAGRSAPKCSRASSISATARPACCSATAPARSCWRPARRRASSPASCMPMAATSTSCAFPAPSRAARSSAIRC